MTLTREWAGSLDRDAVKLLSLCPDCKKFHARIDSSSEGLFANYGEPLYKFSKGFRRVLAQCFAGPDYGLFFSFGHCRLVRMLLSTVQRI